MSSELILIVEDHDKNRKLVHDILQHQGYAVLQSETAEEGLRLAREARPALILMDIRLPGMNGLEALARLRADPLTSSIPVIAITASAMSEEQVKIREAGFDGYQPKPIELLPFLERVRDLLGYHRIQKTES